jgi:hypothetical protein
MLRGFMFRTPCHIEKWFAIATSTFVGTAAETFFRWRATVRPDTRLVEQVNHLGG